MKFLIELSGVDSEWEEEAETEEEALENAKDMAPQMLRDYGKFTVTLIKGTDEEAHA